MTPGGRVPLGVHVCTRNRPRSVRLLLADLAAVLDGFDATVTLYDDSTTASWRAASRAACAAAAVEVRYFGEAERRELVASAAAALPSARECLAVSRPLGTRGWDLAGVRFTAMLDAALDREPATAHLFLDDDIRLAECSYGGERLAVDARTLGEALREEAGSKGLLAAGAPFLGRADLSALEHFEAFLDRVLCDEPVAGLRGPNAVANTGSSASFPVVTTSVAHVHPDSPGISGGFLLTTRGALRTVPLAKSYNEDWMWLRQLAAAGGRIRKLDVAVVHAGPRHFRLSSAGLFLQFEGEVLDLTLARSAGSQTSVTRTVDDAFTACADRLGAVAQKARKAAGIVPELVPALAALDGAKARVRRATPAAYAAQLSEHLRRSQQWRAAFAALGAVPAGGL
ncbi:MAG TPA: hypothetical protein VE760_06580 [Acidimicrobiales bacterium]|nr:hypothetical protein [Acidimicrobiales bacterium]